MYAHECLAVQVAKQLQGCCPHKYAAGPQVPHLEALVAALQEQEQADADLAAAEKVSLALCTSTCKLADPSILTGGCHHDLHAEPLCQGVQSLPPDASRLSCLTCSGGTQLLLQGCHPHMPRLWEAGWLWQFCESWGDLLQRLHVCELQAAEAARQDQEAQLQQLDHEIADLDGQLAQQGASQPTGEAVHQKPVAAD